jgi:hypothetical protein
MDFPTIEHAIQYAGGRWPHLEWRAKTRDEACSPCPWCGGDDRFVLWISGYYMCRAGDGHCGRVGWLDEEEQHVWTPEERRLRRLEAEQAHARQERADLERRVSAIERLNRSQIHERYHGNLDAHAYEWWTGKGVECWAIQDYKLGYCPCCPTDAEHRPSYTIPLPNQERTALLNLRHRLESAPNGDKYRPEMAGLGTCLAFPHHLIDAERGIIVEGEIKALVCAQHGFPAVGIMGKGGKFKTSWLDLFPAGRPIYLALDPDARESAERLGAGIAKTGKEVYVARFPAKPDDMLVEGCAPAEWEHYLKLARRVH